VVDGLAYRYLGRVDKNYSRLLNEGIPFLNAMQSATAQSSRAYAVIIDLTQTQTPAEVAALEAELAKIREVADRIFGSPLYEKAVPAELKPAYEEIRAMRNDNRVRREHFMDFINAGRRADATTVLRTEISPAQKTYISKLDAFCDRYQDTFAALNQKLSDDNFRNRSLLFGLSAAPVAILLGMLIAGIAMILATLVLIVPRSVPERKH
jgi:tetrahydromethanopterin S-methyltransferase subunit F